MGKKNRKGIGEKDLPNVEKILGTKKYIQKQFQQ